jgi:molybdenum cofactor biosynthesis protein B
MAHDEPVDHDHDHAGHDSNRHEHHHPHRDRGPEPRKQAAGEFDTVPEEHKARAPTYARVYVLTCSDTRTEATDEGGRYIRERLVELGHVHAGSAIVKDEPALILQQLDHAHLEGAQAVLLTGGTGLSKRDSTFEAVAAAIARPIPGFGELFRSLSYAEIGSAAMLSRALAGVRADGLLIFAMPGSPAAVRLACERLIFPELTHLLEELGR